MTNITRSAFVALAAALLAGPASAGCRLLSCGFVVAGNSALPVIGMHDMTGHRLTVEVAPAYWTLRSDTGGQKADLHAHGYSGAFAVKYEITPAWGVGLVGSFADQSGSSVINAKTSDLLVSADTANRSLAPGGAGFGGGTVTNVGGSFIALMGTYDFFHDPDGFRLPLSIGLARVNSRMDFNHDYFVGATHQVESFHLDDSGMGFVVNISADFLAWDKKLRIMPGFYEAHGLSYFDGFHYDVQRNGGQVQQFSGGGSSTGGGGGSSGGESATNDSPALYITVNYRPWDLGATWNYTQALLGGLVASNSIYSVHWQHRF